MRVLKINEAEIKCPGCKAELAYTSNDVKVACASVYYIICPVCNNTILV